MNIKIEIMKTKKSSNTILSALALTLIIASNSYSQNVGINATGTTPDASAMLDVESTDKGFLMPRVALTGTTDAATIANPATTLLVYNTAIAGAGATAVSPGFYYNSGTAAVPVWTPLASPSKFTIPFGDFRYRMIDATPSPMCGPNSIANEANNNYGDPSISPPNNIKYNTDAIFTAQSNCTFNGLNGWISEPFASGAVVTVSLYVFPQVSGSTPPMGTLVGTTTVTCSSSSNIYSFSIPAPTTPFTAQQGDIFLLYFSQPAAGANFNINGSVEFINN